MAPMGQMNLKTSHEAPGTSTMGHMERTWVAHGAHMGIYGVLCVLGHGRQADLPESDSPALRSSCL